MELWLVVSCTQQRMRIKKRIESRKRDKLNFELNPWE